MWSHCFVYRNPIHYRARAENDVLELEEGDWAWSPVKLLWKLNNNTEYMNV